jgi:hypothetical protein
VKPSRFIAALIASHLRINGLVGVNHETEKLARPVADQAKTMGAAHHIKF